MLVWYFVFKISEGISEIKLVLPHLSPSPLIVPWICLAPAFTAANAFATALSVSLCAWIPIFFPEFILTTTLKIWNI